MYEDWHYFFDHIAKDPWQHHVINPLPLPIIGGSFRRWCIVAINEVQFPFCLQSKLHHSLPCHEVLAIEECRDQSNSRRFWFMQLHHCFPIPLCNLRCRSSRFDLWGTFLHYSRGATLVVVSFRSFALIPWRDLWFVEWNWGEWNLWEKKRHQLRENREEREAENWKEKIMELSHSFSLHITNIYSGYVV